MVIKGVVIFILLFGGSTIAQNSNEVQSKKEKRELSIVARVRAEIIPKEGQKTSYGIALSPENTERFVDYYKNINLTFEQKKIKDNALSKIPATCCPDKPMSTCCCTCNLAKSVWGLSNFLIKEKNYDSKQVKKEALLWLHFIREEYYIKEELKKRGIELSSVGLTPERSSCYTRRCNLSFKESGCGGMN
jgi:hypothetical protein